MIQNVHLDTRGGSVLTYVLIHTMERTASWSVDVLLICVTLSLGVKSPVQRVNVLKFVNKPHILMLSTFNIPLFYSLLIVYILTKKIRHFLSRVYAR